MRVFGIFVAGWVDSAVVEVDGGQFGVDLVGRGGEVAVLESRLEVLLLVLEVA